MAALEEESWHMKPWKSRHGRWPTKPRAIGGVWFCIATEFAAGNAFGVELANDFMKSRSHCASVSSSYGQLPVNAVIEDDAEEGARMAISSNCFHSGAHI